MYGVYLGVRKYKYMSGIKGFCLIENYIHPLALAVLSGELSREGSHNSHPKELN